MTKLCEFVAISDGVKRETQELLTEANKKVQKPDLFSGHVRTYAPRDADPSKPEGETQPDDRKLPQDKVTAILARLFPKLVKMLDVVCTVDDGNRIAKADVVVDGKTLVADVPVPTLLWLEKKFTDLRTFIGNLPVLDPARLWTFNPASNWYEADPGQTNRTRKMPRPVVKYPATPEHPAQTELFTEDVWIGTWTERKFSGAIPEALRDATLDRCTKLIEAIKKAREAANTTTVSEREIGTALLSFVLGPEGRPTL